jgi:transposase
MRRWDEDRTLDRIPHALYVLCREQAGREASPTAAIIDSQSVKGAEKGGAASTPRATTRQEDQGQEAARPGRHSRPADAGHHPRGRRPGPRWWNVADSSLFSLYPFLLKLYADGGYQGTNFQAGLRTTCRQINLEIAKRSELRKFVVLPRRWIVERTTAWLNRCDDWPRIGSA